MCVGKKEKTGIADNGWVFMSVFALQELSFYHKT